LWLAFTNATEVILKKWVWLLTGFFTLEIKAILEYSYKSAKGFDSLYWNIDDAIYKNILW
jgi:hypothetical protein